MTTLTLEPQPVPLRVDEHGAIRVGATRVSLDSVVEAFKEGATPEEIVQYFDTLQLADVYAVISYYLKNTEEIDVYLNTQDLAAEAKHTAWMARWPEHSNYRKLLLARLAAKETKDAAVGE